MKSEAAITMHMETLRRMAQSAWDKANEHEEDDWKRAYIRAAREFEAEAKQLEWVLED